MSSSIERAIQPHRIQTVDALRGLAALAVVFYHVQGALSRGAQPWFPDPARRLTEGGHFGVNVFFVLSGFVIARSVRDGSMTLGYLGRFTLRRSIRLDPPYWTAVILEVLLIYVGLAIFPSLATPVPSMPQLLAHTVYLQDILGLRPPHPDLLDPLLRVPVLPHLRRDARPLDTSSRSGLIGGVANGALVILFSALFLASLGAHHGWIAGVHRGVALDRWYEFFTGVVAWWVVSGVLPLADAAWRSGA